MISENVAPLRCSA